MTEQTMELDGKKDVGLWSLFWTFLKIGSTAFGGFMALISVVQNYVVERRKLMSPEEMLDGVSLATILPGPIAVNVVAYVGYKLRGGVG
ncbi:MAG: chromate transporter, partial [Chromatiales bacterium]|nr:chromate transporter [Chromatiales bacterium]